MGTKNLQFSEADLDNLISSVEGALAKASNLSKAIPPQQDDQDAPPAAAAAAPADDAAAAAAAAPPAADPAADPAAAAAPGADPAADPAAAAQAPGMPGAPADEAALQQEGQPGDEGAPLSDEELNEIYASMPPEELERHYMIIRQHLQQAYAKAEADAGESQGGGIEAEGPRGANQTTHDGPTGGNESAMGKSEQDSEIAALKAKVAEQGRALETIAKGFEIMTKPARKSVTGTLDYIRKSEFDQAGGENGDVSGLSKAEKVAKLKEIGPAPLTKDERDQVNAYILRDEFEGTVDKILARGKK